MAEKTVNSTVVSEDIVFRGEISYDNHLVIEGQVEGSIRSSGRLDISASGRVIGDIFVKQVSIEGFLQGNIKEADSVLIHKSGNLNGDLETRELQIERGGKHTGLTLMK